MDWLLNKIFGVSKERAIAAVKKRSTTPDWSNIERHFGHYNFSLRAKFEDHTWYYAHGHGAKKQTKITINPSLIRDILAASDRVQSPKQERDWLRWVLPYLEEQAAKQSKTTGDKPSVGWAGGADQLDCVDEAINGTAFLLYLHAQGRIKYHRILGPVWKHPLFKWLHYGTGLYDVRVGRKWVLDMGVNPVGEGVLITPWEYWYTPNEHYQEAESAI